MHHRTRQPRTPGFLSSPPHPTPTTAAVAVALKPQPIQPGSNLPPSGWRLPAQVLEPRVHNQHKVPGQDIRRRRVSHAFRLRVRRRGVGRASRTCGPRAGNLRRNVLDPLPGLNDGLARRRPAQAQNTQRVRISGPAVGCVSALKPSSSKPWKSRPSRSSRRGGVVCRRGPAVHCNSEGVPLEPVSQPPPTPCDIPSGLLFLYGALDSHPFFPSHVASGRCFPSAAAAGAPAGVVSAFAEPSGWCAGAVLDAAGCRVSGAR